MFRLIKYSIHYCSFEFLPFFFFSVCLSGKQTHFHVIFLHLICLWDSVSIWSIYPPENSKSTRMCQWELCHCSSPHFKTPHTFLCHVTKLNQKHGLNCSAISRVNISLSAVHLSTPWADNCAWIEIWQILCLLSISCFSLWQYFICNLLVQSVCAGRICYIISSYLQGSIWCGNLMSPRLYSTLDFFF